MPLRPAASCLALAAASAPALAQFPSPPARPDTYLARLEALALVQTLNATLLGSRSATFALERWCADHRLAAEPRIVARLVRDVHKAPTPEQRRRLQVSDEEPIRYRRVELVCGGHVLSEADNWYVPSRLTPEMNRLLETTDTPFGRAVQELKPYRQTFAVEVHWQPLQQGWETAPQPDVCAAPAGGPLDVPRTLFEHRAVLYTADRTPFSEVDETYLAEILAFARGGAKPDAP